MSRRRASFGLRCVQGVAPFALLVAAALVVRLLFGLAFGGW